MIPQDYITEWRGHAPWVQDAQVEQDLVISRALVEIYAHPTLSDSLVFRGGTALYKLHLAPALRYSEDIDLVQRRAEQAGPAMTALRSVLDPWLGEPKWKQSEGRVTFVYRFLSEGLPQRNLRLKVEINSREHFSVYGYVKQSFAVSSRWFSGNCEIATYEFDELLGTKLRALYQRKKGRDLLDLAVALQSGKADPRRMVDAFLAYMRHGGHRITRTIFEQNLDAKLRDPLFMADIGPLLAPGFVWDIEAAAEIVRDRVLSLLPQ